MGEAVIVKGERSLLPDGLALIGIRASELVKRYYHYEDVPHIQYENETQKFTLGAKDNSQDKKEDLFWLEKNQAVRKQVKVISDKTVLSLKINQLGDLFMNYTAAVQYFVQKYPEVHRMDQKEGEFFKDNIDYQRLIAVHRRFVEEFYITVSGTAKELRTDQWKLLEDYSISLLTDYPLEAYQGYKIDPIKMKPDFAEELEEAIQ